MKKQMVVIIQNHNFQGEKPVPDERLARIGELIDSWFVFSMVWTIGATCDNDGRKKFDAWTRETMKTANVSICTRSG